MYKTKFLSTILFMAAIFFHTQLAAQITPKPLLAVHNAAKIVKPESSKANYHKSQLSKSRSKEKRNKKDLFASGLPKSTQKGLMKQKHDPAIPAGSQKPVYSLNNPALKINRIKP
ncbi:MAG: hypothetical protein AAF696_35990 [Bacteroidota bacterium]